MRKILSYVIPALILFGVLALQYSFPSQIESFRAKVFDIFQMIKPRVFQDTPVRIIDIDDESLEKIGQWPWPRTILAWSSTLAQYDVTGDFAVTQADVTYELNHYFLTSYGDADMNKATDFVDFQALLDHWQASGPAIGWAQADFNGDGRVDFLDFQMLLNYWEMKPWNFASSEAPEPASVSLLLLGGLALLRRKT